jgi:hypothetical protein
MARAWLVGVMVVTGLAWGGPGLAQSKKARVRAHKAKAFDLFEKGDYAAGISEMEKAHALIPHPGFLLNIAVAYDRWPGHCEESLQTFERFFMECEDCKLLAGARKKHAEVESTCRVVVSIRSTPDGARVAVNGAFRGKTPFTTRLLPGTYAIVLDLSEHDRATATLEVERGKPRELELELVRKKIEPPPPPPPITVVTEPEPHGPSPFTWVAFGIGGAGLITGATFTGLAMQDLDREEEARRTPLPKAEIEALQRRAKRDAIIAHVGYGVAVAGAAAGVLLFFFTRGDAEPKLAVAPSLGPGSIGVAGSF